jgi:hypothetical protein
MSMNEMKKGFVKLPRRVLLDANLQLSDMAVYCGFRSFRYEKRKNKVYASKQQVADLLGCSVDVVKRALKRLHLGGHIIWVRGGTGHANSYTFIDDIDVAIQGAQQPQGEGAPAPFIGATEPHQEEPKNKNQKGQLRHGKDICWFDTDGTLIIFNFTQKRKQNFGGGDYESFSYLGLTGMEAYRLAKEHHRARKALP